MRGSVLQQAAFAGVAGDDAVPFLAHRRSGRLRVVEVKSLFRRGDLAAGQALGVEAGQPDDRPSSARRRGRGTGSAAGSGKGVALMGVGGSYVAGGDAELAKIAGS